MICHACMETAAAGALTAYHAPLTWDRGVFIGMKSVGFTGPVAHAW
jgi:hypothetical protein